MVSSPRCVGVTAAGRPCIKPAAPRERLCFSHLATLRRAELREAEASGRDPATLPGTHWRITAKPPSGPRQKRWAGSRSAADGVAFDFYQEGFTDIVIERFTDRKIVKRREWTLEGWQQGDAEEY